MSATQQLIEHLRQNPKALRRLDAEDMAVLDFLVTEDRYDKLDQHCGRDPLYWAQTWTATENPHY